MSCGPSEEPAVPADEGQPRPHPAESPGGAGGGEGDEHDGVDQEVPVPDASGHGGRSGPRRAGVNSSATRAAHVSIAGTSRTSPPFHRGGSPSDPPFAPSSGQSPHAACRRRPRQSPPRRTRRDRSPGPWPRPPAPGTRAGRERRRGRWPAARSTGRRRTTVAAGSPGTSPRQPIAATSLCHRGGLLPRGSLRASDRAAARGSSGAGRGPCRPGLVAGPAVRPRHRCAAG